MKRISWSIWIIFFAALLLGVLLHFLYAWFPNPLTALVSPVRESLWEHLKILFYPLLAAALLLTRNAPALRAARLLAALVSCALMLGAGWAYHIVLQGDSLAFDLALYAVLMALAFLLPRLLWPLGRRAWGRAAACLLTALLWALLVWFSFLPPDHLLFADLNGAARTFLTIPV